MGDVLADEGPEDDRPNGTCCRHLLKRKRWSTEEEVAEDKRSTKEEGAGTGNDVCKKLKPGEELRRCRSEPNAFLLTHIHVPVFLRALKGHCVMF